MRFNHKTKLSVFVKGVFDGVIPYEVRNESGDWSPYFGQWEGQKKDDTDTNCCWAFAGNEVLEDQLEFLMKTGKLSDYEIQWFKDKGYIDEDGDFYFSRRFIPVISGVKRNGNDEAEFWRLTKKYGAIPNSMLPYTNMYEYFDKTKITPEMYALGEEFKERISIKYKELGTRFKGYIIDELQLALKQSELQIAIPVPQNGLWNSTKIDPPDHNHADHSVALFKIDRVTDPVYPFYVYDQYNPTIKQLRYDYFIPICTFTVIESNLLSPTLTKTVFQKVLELLTKYGIIKLN